MLTLVRWPRLAGVVLVLLAFELAWGAGLFALKRAGLASVSLMPPGEFEPQRFEWHPLLQAVPIPSLKLTSSTGLAIQHTREGTRGKDPAGSLEGRTVIATFGGSTTYDIGANEGEPGPIGWPGRWIGQRQGRYFVVNHGVPGYTTAEHLIQTAFTRPSSASRRAARSTMSLERPAQRAIAGLDPAMPISICRPDRFAEGAPCRRRARHLLAAAHASDARRRRQPRHRALLRRSLCQPPVSGDDPDLDTIYKRNIAAIRRSTAGAVSPPSWSASS